MTDGNYFRPRYARVRASRGAPTVGFAPSLMRLPLSLLRWALMMPQKLLYKAFRMEQERHNATILGGGSFGTAMASILAANGHRVNIWVRDPETAAAINLDRENSRYLPGAELPAGVNATDSLEEALDQASLVFVAIPSKAFVDVLRQAREWVPAGTGPFYQFPSHRTRG